LKEDEEGLRGHPGDQQEGTSYCSQHHERPEMMIVRLAAHRAFFFNATKWYQPESAGGLHRKKKETYRGTISSLYRAGERWRAGLIPLAAKSCARLATKTSQDGRAANPPNCEWNITIVQSATSNRPPCCGSSRPTAFQAEPLLDGWQLPYGSYPGAQSLQGPAPQSRTFLAQDIRWKRHAFSSRVSRNRKRLQERK
jgi:hypothetical protein